LFTHIHRHRIGAFMAVLLAAVAGCATTPVSPGETKSYAPPAGLTTVSQEMGQITWGWADQPATAPQRQDQATLDFDLAQKPQGIFATLDPSRVRSRWLSMRVDFKSDHKGWVGIQYQLKTDRDKAAFIDPTSALSSCKKLDDGWISCVSYTYVPPTVTSARAEVVGYHVGYSIKHVELRFLRDDELLAPVATDAAQFQHTLDIMRQRFFRSNDVDWNALMSETSPWLASPSRHGWISAIAWIAHEIPSGGHTSVRRVQTDASAAGSTAEHNVVKQLSPDVGYVKLTGTPPTPAGRDSYANETLAEVEHLVKAGISHWIVDLRGDHGGSIYAMTNAIAPLLGPRALGQFQANDGSSTFYGLNKQGSYETAKNAPDKQYVVIHLPADFSFTARTLHVYALADRTCASACEALLVGLNDMASAKTFGEPTAGFSSGNATYPLGDAFSLVLTQSYLADVQGKRVFPRVTPEVDLGKVSHDWLAYVEQVVAGDMRDEQKAH
jgi:hypothetical protein